MTDPVVIVAAARTPLGAFQGELSSFSAAELGACAIAGALKPAGMNQPAINPAHIEQVLMGCVLPAGQGQAPARQAALGAGLPESVACTTINKMCGSGMQAVILAHDQILAGSAQVIAAGGMESMSNAPYLLPKVRAGLRLGHNQVIDHLFFDGLEDAYARNEQGGRLFMGVFAEQCAAHFGFSRTQQDEWAIRSTERAQTAQAAHWFDHEISSLLSPKGQALTSDEGPRTARLDKIPQLKPAFQKDGTVTAANASSISDGAAALVLMRASHAQQLGYRPLAKIVAHSVHAQAPAWFTTAPVGAIQKVLNTAGWSSDEVDLYEINEAFAVVTLAAIHELQLDPARVNVYGGACALGHPIGASGARIIVTLLNALRQRQGRRGIASLCIGGGEATAIALEVEE